jgi:chemotaxis protein methyltransferase CheR
MDDIATNILEFFATFIKEKSGIIYQESNFYMLEGRLHNLAKHMGFETVGAMYKQAKIHMPEEMKLMLSDLATNNETHFFRDQNVFKGIEETVRGDADYYKNLNRPLKLWSAACSYGQEVYSVIMTLENLRAELPHTGYDFLATDISTQALAGAKKGIYTQMQVQRGLPTRLLIKNFDKISDEETNYEWKVKPHLQENITFKQANLLDQSYGREKYDFIFCRNVLIYQNKEMKEIIINRLYDYLNPGGYLVLGTAESLIGMKHHYKVINGSNHVFFQRPKEEELIGQAV